MSHRYPLLILLSLLVLLACGIGIWSQFQPAFNAPFTATLTDARTVTVHPLPGVPLPAGLKPDDRLNLPSMDFSARFLLLPLVNDDAMYPGASRSYQLRVRRGDAQLAVVVTSVNLGGSPAARLYTQWNLWSLMFQLLVFTVLALIILWRGREWAAAGLGLWVIAGLCGIAGVNLHFDGVTGLVLILASEILFLLARIGLYLMVDFLLGTTLSAGARRLWRGLFLVILAAGAVPQIAGSVLFLTAGWAGLLFPAWQAIWVMSYLIPVVMLFTSYRSTPVAERLRLRWMLWSGALWVIAIGIFDVRPFGLLTSNILGGLGQLLGVSGFLYAVLRHRALDVSVAIDRTLVYGSVTALVVGILAALNSILQHAALGTSASLLLRIVVPLALGIVLGQVRNHADRLVERVFFRKRYLAEKALRRFARHCSQFEAASELLQACIEEIRHHLKVPAVAIYERGEAGYRRTQAGGDARYPEYARPDDPAFVAARADQKEIDLTQLRSALGAEGYVFAMMGSGGLQGVLVCANRPGEHFASDERKLLAYVARQVGATLSSENVRESLRFVRAVARGMLDPAAAREQALRLESKWLGR